MGLPSDMLFLMINADDFGLCAEANAATIEGLTGGFFTSASVIVPAPAFAHAAELVAYGPGLDVGVHLTLTSEWPEWRWGPVMGADRVPSLVDEGGFFYPNNALLFARAQADDVEAELVAQIETALAYGIDVTHLDCHMGPLHLRADYHAIYIRLAQRYRLPIRIPPMPAMRRLGLADTVAHLDTAGIFYPDNFIFSVKRSPESVEAAWRSVLENLPAGISEIYCHPAHPGPKIRRFASDAPVREADFDFFRTKALGLIDSLGLQLINYRTMREAMRAGLNAPVQL
jgi:predicted glycoside hydrolase/deacetylase ChbG (UPF0249 family)